MKIDIKTEGIAEVQNAFRELKEKDARAAVSYGVRQAAIFLRDFARKSVPIGPRKHLQRVGKKTKLREKHYKLSRSITYLGAKKAQKTTGVSYSVGQGKAYHGIFLEFGTKKMAKRPWLRPAAKEATPHIYEIVKKAVDLYILRKKLTKK